MQITPVDFTAFDCTVETLGKNLVLRMAIKSDAPVPRSELYRAVVALYNYHAIDFIPTVGEREFDNLHPYNPETDDYVLLLTRKKKLMRAIDLAGFINMAWATSLLCHKRDKSKPKIRKRSVTPFWKEVKAGGLDAQQAAFVHAGEIEYRPSEAPEPYKFGTF